MISTEYPHIDAMLTDLLAQLQRVLGDNLLGVYLYGSLVMGDFDDGLSDVDLLVATARHINQTEFEALHRVHQGIVAGDKQWDNRLEIAYVSRDALQSTKTKSSKMGIISPGEPFHIVDSEFGWLMNWYMVREHGVTLLGPPPQDIIEDIHKDDFVKAVKGHLYYLRDYVDGVQHQGGQGYVILTMCRGLHTLRHGEQLSKKQAAEWAEKELPQWATLIRQALVWRMAPNELNADHKATIPETKHFVQYVIGLAF